MTTELLWVLAPVWDSTPHLVAKQLVAKRPASRDSDGFNCEMTELVAKQPASRDTLEQRRAMQLLKEYF